EKPGDIALAQRSKAQLDASRSTTPRA
ncbi:MAG: hypothetical protein JWQ88_3649, partial [Rhodoferax sp.]|nr:hypothetical protein [Rhodoferax sp.]